MGSEVWDKVARQVDFNLQIDRDRFCNIVDPRSKILDFGCGYGRIAKELTECGYTDVLGIDPSSSMVGRGLEMFPGLSLLHSAETVMPFDDGSFDAVIVCAVFTCIPSPKDRARSVAEILRVLKPGGVLHVSEFSLEEGWAFTSDLGMPMRYSSAEEMRNLLCVFQCVHEEVVGATTMSGNPASNYRAFYKKPLNKAMHPISG